jgi:uncharacterized membrane protein
MEDDAYEFAIKKFDNIIEFDKEIQPFLELEYEKTKVFMKILMNKGSQENKNYSFDSKVVNKYIQKYGNKLTEEIISGTI